MQRYNSGSRADSQGDWKIGGFGFGVSTKNEPGADNEYEFPEYDSRLPRTVQRNLDFLGMFVRVGN
jgi:SCY1-like protein 2